VNYRPISECADEKLNEAVAIAKARNPNRVVTHFDPSDDNDRFRRVKINGTEEDSITIRHANSV
jgi:hypothetical protein